jgi:acyl-CoA thioesterase
MSFASHLGLTVTAQGEGRAELRVTVSAEHLNLHGSAHGGFLYAVAHEAFALAANSHGAPAVALATHMDYFSIVREGDELVAVATEEHLGRRVATYRAEVRRGADTVALFTGTVYRMEAARS